MRRWLVIPAGILLGLAAETGWPPGIELRVVLADLAIGWLLIGGGFVVWHSRPANLVGPLLITTGATWFIATFAATDYPPASLLYLGPLIHVLVAHPTGRWDGRTRQGAVVAGYAMSVLAVWLPLTTAGIAIGVLIAAVGAVDLVGTLQGRGRSRLATDPFSVALGLILAGASVARLRGTQVDDAALVAYQIVLAAIILSIVAEIVWRASAPAVLARFVVDLGGSAEAGTLRARLARAVGDPSLVLGYAVPGERDAWVDESGAPLIREASIAGRAVTPIIVGGIEWGFVAYDPSLVGDPHVAELLAAAAGLAISNSATQAEIRRRVAKVDASRERLVHAADAQGRRIEAALDSGVDARLAHVAELLTDAAHARPSDPHLDAVLRDLAAARDRLRDFSRGVYPPMLSAGGLGTAIEDLAERSPLPVDARVARSRYDPAVESTLYFVCSEALANVAKHARASRVRIELRDEPEGPVLSIEDDGMGGAVAGGSGLRGLADRVEALGGSLLITSRAGNGTSVTAAVPRGRAVLRTAPAIA